MSDRTILEGRAGVPVSRSAIENALARAGITSGDIVMVHSRLFTVGKIPPGVERDEVSGAFLTALEQAVGPDGLVVVPTFTLSVCETGVFDVSSTPSEMGALTEYARLSAPRRRTHHPIYSAVMLGAPVELFANLNAATCFGSNSLFDRLHTLNSVGATRERVKFLTVGIACPPEGITYIHSVEEKKDVPYRYHKSFHGTIHKDGLTSPYEVDFFVRDRDAGVEFDGSRCWELLRDKDGVQTAALGDSFVCVIPERVIFEAISEAITAQPDVLCRGGYRPAG